MGNRHRHRNVGPIGAERGKEFGSGKECFYHMMVCIERTILSQDVCLSVCLSRAIVSNMAKRIVRDF